MSKSTVGFGFEKFRVQGLRVSAIRGLGLDSVRGWNLPSCPHRGYPNDNLKRVRRYHKLGTAEELSLFWREYGAVSLEHAKNLSIETHVKLYGFDVGASGLGEGSKAWDLGKWTFRV